MRFIKITKKRQNQELSKYWIIDNEKDSDVTRAIDSKEEVGTDEILTKKKAEEKLIYDVY